MTKAELRKYYIGKRREMTHRDVANADIADKVFALPEFTDRNVLLTYVSGGIEVDTRRILKRSFKTKEIYCPRCETAGNLMHFCRVTEMDQLRKGYFNIDEPTEECEVRDSFDESAVCIVPGLTFDLEGTRIGFGRGFYDRFLHSFKGVRIGLCYECCISDGLPAEDFDEKVDIIITEERILRLRDI